MRVLLWFYRLPDLFGSHGWRQFRDASTSGYGVMGVFFAPAPYKASRAKLGTPRKHSNGFLALMAYIGLCKKGEL